MTIKEAQELVDAWGDKHAIQSQRTGEHGLADRGDRQAGARDGPPLRRARGRSPFPGRATDEIGDILWALIGVANQTGVDLTAALIRALERKSEESEAPSGRKA